MRTLFVPIKAGTRFCQYRCHGLVLLRDRLFSRLRLSLLGIGFGERVLCRESAALPIQRLPDRLSGNLRTRGGIAVRGGGAGAVMSPAATLAAARSAPDRRG